MLLFELFSSEKAKSINNIRDEVNRIKINEQIA